MENEAGGANGMGSMDGGLGNMFSDPKLIEKLANNPKTSPLLADPEFMMKLQRIRQDPSAFGPEMGDPRFLQVLGVLLGVDMQLGDPSNMPAGATTASFGGKEAEEDVEMSDAKPSAKEPEPVPEPEPEDEEELAKKEAKAKADEEKKLGTESYKKRQFDAAIEHYSKAWELYKDITYLTNLGAAYFEKGDYEKAIEVCKEAVEHGREVYADFKLIAK
jgi:stress-induced-phosphoprotein 1